LTYFEEFEVGQALFPENLSKEIARKAGQNSDSFRSLDLGLTESAGDSPADPAAILAVVDTICILIHCGGAHSFGFDIWAVRLAATFQDFPAVDPFGWDHGLSPGQDNPGVARALFGIDPFLIRSEGDAQGIGHLVLGVAKPLPDFFQPLNQGVTMISMKGFSTGHCSCLRNGTVKILNT
jgi:hypothetical protein